jgi:hypothetical protein
VVSLERRGMRIAENDAKQTVAFPKFFLMQQLEAVEVQVILRDVAKRGCCTVGSIPFAFSGFGRGTIRPF